MSDGALFSSGARHVAAATQTCQALAGVSLRHVKFQTFFLNQDHAEKRNGLARSLVGLNGAETQVIPDKVLVLFVAPGQLKMFLFLDVPMQLDETRTHCEFDHQSVEEQEECLDPAKYVFMLVCVNGTDGRQHERERPRASSL